MPGKPCEAFLLVLAGLLLALQLNRQSMLPGEEQLAERVPAGWFEVLPSELESAPARELRRLPRIGQQRALDIVRWRWEHEEPLTLESLESIHGIGPQTIEDLRPELESP